MRLLYKVMLCCVIVLCRPLPPDDASSVANKRRAHFSDTQELHRRCVPVAVCRQSHHIRLVLEDVVSLVSSQQWLPSTLSSVHTLQWWYTVQTLLYLTFTQEDVLGETVLETL